MLRGRGAGPGPIAGDLVGQAMISDPGATRVSIVMPAYQEGDSITAVLERLPRREENRHSWRSTRPSITGDQCQLLFG